MKDSPFIEVTPVTEKGPDEPKRFVNLRFIVSIGPPVEGEPGMAVLTFFDNSRIPVHEDGETLRQMLNGTDE